MRIAICDDEAAGRELLRKYLEEWGKDKGEHIETVCFSSAESFLFSWEDDRSYDLLVLDIEMGEMNGMELAKRLRQDSDEIPILFVTGYEQYMAQGYEVSAIHYLLKPLDKGKLITVLDRLHKRQPVEERIVFPTDKGPVSLSLSTIWFIEASGHYCLVNTEDASFLVTRSISELETEFQDREELVRCHRSYLVNLKHVQAIVKAEVILDDRRRLPMSRSAGKSVNERFIKYYSGRRD